VTEPSIYASEPYFQQFLGKALAARASDIHFKQGMPPAARVRGELIFFRTDPLTADDMLAVASHVVQSPNVRTQLGSLKEHDAAYAIPEIGRFRVNVYRQRGALAVVLRVIPLTIPTMEELGLPPACRFLAERERGLVLVVGAAGNGKSTSLAAMIGHLNRTQPLHIVTIEDPIEFLHTDDRSSVSQREVGLDTDSFADALRASLRQDPDVILVGEIRDETTMDIALKAAETGHLVFATLHTPDVSRTIGRVLALAPRAAGNAVEEMRQRLGDVLQGIVAQRLVPRADGQGVVLAAEVLVATGTARASIQRPEANPPLKEVMEKGRVPYGMQSFKMAFEDLVQKQLVDPALASQLAAF
jgi:twitching motility protein PilT